MVTSSAVDTPLLAQLCAAEDFDGATDLLRWGPFLPAGMRCAPSPGLGPRVSWLRLRRVPPPEEGVVHPLTTLVMTLAASASDFRLVASRPDEAPPVLYLGLDTDDDRVKWLRSLVAPAVLLERCAPPPRPPAEQGGLVYRLTAQSEQEPQAGRQGGTESRSALARLLLVPSSPWAVIIQGHCVDKATIERHVAAVEKSLDVLAPLRSRTEAITRDGQPRSNGPRSCASSGGVRRCTTRPAPGGHLGRGSSRRTCLPASAPSCTC